MTKINKTPILRIGVILLIILAISIAAASLIFEGKTDAPIYIDSVKYYSAISKKTNSTDAKFDVWYFKNKATRYNKGLAELSAIASATEYNNTKKRPYAEAFLTQMGFDDILPGNYSSKDTMSNKVGYTFARKNVHIDGRKTTLVAVFIRGTTKGEWFSNFNITGDHKNGKPEDKHKGFAMAADSLNKDLEEYLSTHRIDVKSKDTKLWITGHSRGAAVANLLAADYTALNGNSRVYAYTFATPNVTRTPNMINDERDDEYFNNIINFVSNQDFVTQVPLSKTKWKYQKNGRTFIVNSQDPEKKALMESEFKDLTGVDYAPYSKEKTAEAVTSMGKVAADVPMFYKGKTFSGINRKPIDYFNQIARICIYFGRDKYKVSTAFINKEGYSFGSKPYKKINSYFSEGNLGKFKHSHSPETYLCFVRAM